MLCYAIICYYYMLLYAIIFYYYMLLYAIRTILTGSYILGISKSASSGSSPVASGASLLRAIVIRSSRLCPREHANIKIVRAIQTKLDRHA